MKPARWEYWRNRKRWSLYQLTFLLDGLEPVQHADFSSLPEQVRLVLEQRGRDLLDFMPSYPGFAELTFRGNTLSSRLETEVESRELLHWVDSLEGWKIPEQFAPLIARKGQTDVSKRERDTLLLIIAALAKMANISLTHPWASAPAVSAKLRELGITRAESTVANKLREAESLLKNH